VKDQAVAEFIEQLEPTLRKPVEQLRKAILSASPTIEEGIKWNVPSFRTTEWFATFHLRGGVKLILHLGARTKKTKKVEVDSELLQWLGKERAMITFADAQDVKTKLPALKRLIKEWITLL
jgi:hypothetical protein